MSELSPILEIAYDILREEKKELHVNAIAFKACNSNRNLGLTLEVFTSKLSAAILANTKTQKPLFARVKNKKGTAFQKGIYRRRQLRPQPLIHAPSRQVGTLFTGKAGEYAVMSELLFWGFNVSLMSVDEGIDIVASQNNRYFHIQVKTSYPDVSGRYGFSIKRQSFQLNANSSTFYIFVLREKTGNKYAVLPNSEIEAKTISGIINGDTNLSLCITYDQISKKYKMNRKIDLDVYINNFSLIK